MEHRTKFLKELLKHIVLPMMFIGDVVDGMVKGRHRMGFPA
jgi:hypothetical protein